MEITIGVESGHLTDSEKCISVGGLSAVVKIIKIKIKKVEPSRMSCCWMPQKRTESQPWLVFA